MTDVTEAAADPAALAAHILDEEARRHAAQGEARKTYTDDDLSLIHI